MTPCQECQEKFEFSITVEAVSSRFIHEFILASTAHEWTTLVTIVSYKRNVAAKHGSSNPLTTNEMWLLELWMKSTPYIGLHTWCIMGYVQIVYWVEREYPQDCGRKKKDWRPLLCNFCIGLLTRLMIIPNCNILSAVTWD